MGRYDYIFPMLKYFIMIYLVSNNQKLYNSNKYKVISVEESLKMLKSWDRLQFDTETSGRDAHICEILCISLGNREAGHQIVVDIKTTRLLKYKEILESTPLVGQNLKFDLKFLYSYGIVPKEVYDTMIVEQLLYLGYPPLGKEGGISFSLQAIADRYLGIYLDKSVRGEITWRGLDENVVEYAAHDVTYLEDIVDAQLQACKDRGCLKAAELECNFVPVIAYLEWSGIKLDKNKWKKKMEKDLANLEEAKKALNEFVINHPKLQKYVYYDAQGDLFTGFDLEPKVRILWTSSDQVIPVAKILGFDTNVKDKKTGEDKESVIERHLKKQKGINDEFLRLYFGKGEEGDEDYFAGHQGAAKVVSSFGQTHLDAINPVTGRIHTEYKQLGADTGRMSSGSKQNNTDLAKVKRLAKVTYPNMQQLPADVGTRSCFVAEEGNLWVSCDYSGMESRLGADIYNEKSMQEEFLHGTKDIHSLVAKKCFSEIKDLPTQEIKRDYPHLRTKAKPIGFSQQFGGSAYAIQNAMGNTLEEATEIANSYNKGFPGIADFKKKGEKFVKEKGYIVLTELTGHKTYWWDWNKWKSTENTFTSNFWDGYRQLKGSLSPSEWTSHPTRQLVSNHYKSASKWARKALNSPTQGTGAVILKDSQIEMFRWVVKNGLFGKALLVALVHDESNWEFPEELKDTFPKKLKEIMEASADKYCKSLPIPADAAVETYWKH